MYVHSLLCVAQTTSDKYASLSGYTLNVAAYKVYEQK